VGGQVGGFDPRRAVQVITTRGASAGRRGSGYRVTGDMVLTAAHVVYDASSVRLRFLTEDGETRESRGETVWADSASDIALVAITDRSATDGQGTAEVPPVRFARVTGKTACEVLGFPRFRTRVDPASPDPDALLYRDSHHATGHVTSWSYQRAGSLEVSVDPPEYDREQGRSPWEGMSGAVVWSDGCVIGVITEQHRSDGLGRLTASRVDRWYKRLTPARIQELNELIGLPIDAGQLDQLPRSAGRAKGKEPREPKKVRDFVDAVQGQWHKEEEQRRVYNPFPLPVRFRSADASLVDHWGSIRNASPGTNPGPLELTGRLGQILRVYQSIPSRRLVVLGAAGAGKTILTSRFLLDVMSDRAPGDPIPVIFGLASWDPSTTSLRDWMCGQLVRDYPGLDAPDAHGRSLAGALVDGGRILPVLDGFDEIASGLRREALRTLNDANIPLLLTSRPTEYGKAVKRTRALRAAAVIELEALVLGDFADYLTRASRRVFDGGEHKTVWEPVLAALRTRPRATGAKNVAAAFTTPLMVAMASTVYNDTSERDPSELLDTALFPTDEAVQTHLLKEFVPAAYRRRLTIRGTDGRRPRRWNSERAQHWLGYLAADLKARDTPSLAWWEVGAAMRRSLRMLLIGFLAALAFGVTTGVGNVPIDLIGTSHGLRFALERGLVVGVLHGLVAGLGFGLVYGFVAQGAAEPSRVRIRTYGVTREMRARFMPRFRVGLGFGLPAALVLVLVDRGVVDQIGYADGLNGGTLGALVFVPGTGLEIGLVLGLIACLEAPVDIESEASPANLLRANRNNAVLHFLVWLLVFGLGAGLVTALTSGVAFGILAGLAIGITGAFGGGVGYGLAFSAWGQWVALARMWLPLRGQLPWAVIAFLDDACERGVLRRAGAVYQFRHAQLQEHLAHEYQKDRDQQSVSSD
jgi:hypothetical protein